MSFVYRGTRSDLESGFPGFTSERQTVMSPNFLLWLVLGVFFMATSLRMYATCQQLQAQAQAHAAAASALLGYAELRLHMQPSIALATRGRLQGLRLQLALLDQEFDDHDYETLRALGSDNVPNAASMSEEEINALPVHKYKTSAPQCNVSPMQQVSSSNSPQKRQDSTNPISIKKGSEDELTCSVCLEQVSVGDQQVSVSINKCRRSYLQFTLFASDSFPPPFIVYEVEYGRGKY